MGDAWPVVFYVLMAIMLVGMLFHRALAWYVLKRWGKSTRGTVVGCVERNNDGVFYVVSYEFTVPDGLGTMRTHIGKQATHSSMNPKDIVAVRYWSRWPRVSRFTERVA
jgi:hypothetical protein